jgi:hypothetical protein
MRRHRLPFGSAAALTLCVIVVGCGGHTASTTSPRRAAGAGAVVHAFAAVYARYLSGTALVAQLPDATAAARQTAASAGRPPSASVTLVSQKPGDGASWFVVMRDGAHRLYAQLFLAKPSSGWIVNRLVPPDFSTQLQPVVKATGPKVPPGGAAPLRAARGFLKAYLVLTRAQVGRLRDVTPRLRAYLRRNTPDVSGPGRSRVLVVPIHRRGAAWIATPSLSDGTNTYELTIKLIKGAGGQWLADSVKEP